MNSLRTAARLSSPRALTFTKSSASSIPQQFSSITSTTKTHNSSIPKPDYLPIPTISTKYFSTSPEIHELGSVDKGYTADRIDHVAEPERRAFTYLLLSGVRFAYASVARVAIVKFVSSMSASADVLALASAEFELDNVLPGSTITVKWRGKPIFIRRRLSAEIETEEAVPMAHLRDQESDQDRVFKSEWLVVLGICTHLGCVPISNAGDYGGWFCPCHGSHYDISGRIRKGPAPLNLEVPPYKFLSEAKILIG